MTVWLPLHQTQNKIIQETSTKGSHWQKWQLTLCVDVIALKMCQKCNVVICVFWPNVLHHWLMFHFFMTLVSLMSSDHQLVGQLCCKENWVHSSLLLKCFLFKATHMGSMFATLLDVAKDCFKWSCAPTFNSEQWLCHLQNTHRDQTVWVLFCPQTFRHVFLVFLSWFWFYKNLNQKRFVRHK